MDLQSPMCQKALMAQKPIFIIRIYLQARHFKENTYLISGLLCIFYKYMTKKMKRCGSGSVTGYATSPLSVAFSTALYFELSATGLYKLSRRDLGAQLSQLCYPKLWNTNDLLEWQFTFNRHSKVM